MNELEINKIQIEKDTKCFISNFIYFYEVNNNSKHNTVIQNIYTQNINLSKIQISFQICFFTL